MLLQKKVNVITYTQALAIIHPYVSIWYSKYLVNSVSR